MMEHMGLMGETHVSGLLAETITDYYDVLLRNFDPITWQPTAYVNGTYYSYRIVDNCTVADALEDANGELGAGLSTTTAAVATQESLQLGGFYLGLYRDDFGGLRYLYNRQNYAIESLPTGCLVGSPTTGSPWASTVTTNSSGRRPPAVRLGRPSRPTPTLSATLSPAASWAGWTRLFLSKSPPIR